MSTNTFGHLFSFTTWGESHGPAIGGVVEGVPSGVPLSEKDIQPWLDQRRPGTSRFVSQRQERDQVTLLSGVFKGLTTGTPISLMIANEDQRPKDYEALSELFRPGHADYTYWKKYGVRDPRGGGRASARETAVRVAAGAVARCVLKHLGHDIRIGGAVLRMGALEAATCDWDYAQRNPLRCPDPESLSSWMAYLDTVRKEKSSVGAIVGLKVSGLPPGLGAPLAHKLDGDIAQALMSLPAVKGVEIGEGFHAASLRGEENVDEMREGTPPVFLSNHAGGVLGGISTGQDLLVRFAVKPTSSLPRPLATITQEGHNTTVITRGRHDPCVGARAVPVGEAMLACVVTDHVLQHRTSMGG